MRGFFLPRSIRQKEIDFRILQPGSHMARNAGRARARKGERKDIIYTGKCRSYFPTYYILKYIACMFMYARNCLGTKT